MPSSPPDREPEESRKGSAKGEPGRRANTLGLRVAVYFLAVFMGMSVTSMGLYSLIEGPGAMEKLAESSRTGETLPGEGGEVDPVLFLWLRVATVPVALMITLLVLRFSDGAATIASIGLRRPRTAGLQALLALLCASLPLGLWLLLADPWVESTLVPYGSAAAAPASSSPAAPEPAELADAGSAEPESPPLEPPVPGSAEPARPEVESADPVRPDPFPAELESADSAQPSLEVPPGVAGLASLAFAFLAVAFLEELIFRGYVYSAFRERFTWVNAAGWANLLYVALHAGHPEIGAAGLINVFLVGLACGAMREKSGSLWMPSLFSGLWNTLIGCALSLPISGTLFPRLFEHTLEGPDSLTGGSFGPEGSWLLTAPLLVLVIALGAWVDRGTDFPAPTTEAEEKQPDGEATSSGTPSDSG